MNRVQEEKDYWEKAAKDPDVDKKYIADISLEKSLVALGDLSGEVLEIGCGVGRLMQPGWHGIDISEGMLEIARKRKPKCEFKLTDGRFIPYSDEKFDYVYSVLVFQHLPLVAVNNYLIEALRVLKPEGVLKFQFIEGTEDEPFSKHHDIRSLALGGFVVKKKKGLVHPLWTWVEAYKI